MKVTGSASVAAPLTEVWDALQDPAVLARAIPGCRELAAVGPDSYAMSVTAGVAAIKGDFAGRVELSDFDVPNAFTMRARGQGAPGTVEATVRVTLAAGAGVTLIDYDADAVVGGMIGGVGQRMLAGVAKRTAGEFFGNVEKALAGQDVVEDAPRRPVAEGATYQGRPGPSVREAAGLGAFVAGGAVALAGVAVGYVIGRRR